MAHPCFECGSECYCNGDLDDVIVSHTPLFCCTGCGCEEFLEPDREYYDEDEIDELDEDEL